MTEKKVGEWEPAPGGQKVGEWEPVPAAEKASAPAAEKASAPAAEKASAPEAANNIPNAEEALARLKAAIAEKDYAAIGVAQEDLKAANKARVDAGKDPLPVPSLVAPAPLVQPVGVGTGNSGSILDQIPLPIQRGVGAVTGAGLGLSLGIGPAAAKAYLAKRAIDKFLPKSDAQPTPVATTTETPNSSPWSPSSTPNTPAANPTIPMNGAPAVDYGETPFQRELNQQGKAGQRAARIDEARENANSLGLNVNEPLAEYPDIEATKSGIYAPKNVVNAIEDEKKAELDRRVNAAENARLERQNRALNAATQAGSQWQNLYRRGQELAASAEADSQKLGNLLKQKALDWWRTGVPPFQNIAGRLASAGAGLGFAVPGAVEKARKDDYSGALQELGTGSAVGTALSYIPEQAAGPLNAAVQGMDSIARGSKGDYLGSSLSALGALGPYAAAALFPEFALPAAAATAVIPPAINAARDYYLRNYGTPQGALPTQ